MTTNGQNLHQVTGQVSDRADRSLAHRLGTLPASQRYAVMVLANEGVDLESFKFDSAVGWTQALAVFKQTAAALAKAEKEAEFEVSSPACFIPS
jgi:hypothetical protein